MKLRPWKDMIDVDMPTMGPITEEIRKQTREQAARYRGGVRVSTGRFWTDAEYKKYRDKVLSTPLP
ncbi:MAG: hypothetical protein AMJ79_09735 [Phycisphaerae bacterium SM23_30]|nr:MAG: hypothetical protein AMJ79_09735 [Phycisphaerae bacterium SM23_30]